MELVIDRLEKKKKCIAPISIVANCRLLDDRRETGAICRTQDETPPEREKSCGKNGRQNVDKERKGGENGVSVLESR